MKCPKCGKDIANDSLFCEFCGEQVDTGGNKINEYLIPIRWLLFVAMGLISSSNAFFYEYIDCRKDYWDWVTWSVVPLLSFIVCIPCFILTWKKKLSRIFTLLMFSLFVLNTTIVVFIAELESHYETDYHWIIYKGDIAIGERDFSRAYYTSSEMDNQIRGIKEAINFDENSDRAPYCIETRNYDKTLDIAKFLVYSVFLTLEFLLGFLYLFFSSFRQLKKIYEMFKMWQGNSQ